MKIAQLVNFDEFWSHIVNRGQFDRGDTVRFAYEIGFHVYADLRLNLDLAAAEDARSAMKFIDLLEDFVTISDRCAAIVGARVLEVQGDRIHFLLPTPEISPVSIGRLLVFGSALTRTAYEELKPSAGSDWQGFSMAADYGPAVFVPSTFGGGTLISLGNAANQPAKRLGRGVASGCLAVPARFGSAIPGAKRSGEWVEIDVNKATPVTSSHFDDALTEQMRRTARAVLEQRSSRQVRNFSGGLFEGISLDQTPVRTRGMCLRADLDGFTKAVEAAFLSGSQAVRALVQQFVEIMEYPAEFIRNLNHPVIEIPWAGDCCTIFIQPAFHQTVEQMRACLPVEAGRHWHAIAYENGSSSQWSSRLGSAKWAVGLACGDRNEGGDGSAVVTEFRAAGRTFRVIVGWCARCAKDAQETSGIAGDDTVVPVVDYQNLEAIFQPLFSAIASTYRFSPYAKLKDAGHRAAKALSTTTPHSIVGVTTALPRPQPYWMCRP